MVSRDVHIDMKVCQHANAVSQRYEDSLLPTLVGSPYWVLLMSSSVLASRSVEPLLSASSECAWACLWSECKGVSAAVPLLWSTSFVHDAFARLQENYTWYTSASIAVTRAHANTKTPAKQCRQIFCHSHMQLFRRRSISFHVRRHSFRACY